MGNFHSEITALKQLSHKHVVSYYDAKEEAKMTRPDGKQPKKVSYIVQEIVSGGELMHYIEAGGPFSERMCRYFFK